MRDAYPPIDAETAHISRMYDYLLGGSDYFEVDREAAHEVFARFPGGVEGARADARANRAFLKRAVTYMTREGGLRQFLDIGTGIPTDNTHATAFEVAADCRLVYVDNDPIVLAHAHALLGAASLEGQVDYVFGDAREPQAILEAAARTLDFTQPVGLVLVGLMHVIRDEEGAYEIVQTLIDAVPSGSYLALSQLVTADEDRWSETANMSFSRMARRGAAFRTYDEVLRFFDGTELVDPGVVEVVRWRTDGDVPDRPTRAWGGLGRKP
jgi:hypothetical protein